MNISRYENGGADLIVARIGLPEGQSISKAEDLEKYVEEPAIESCTDLFKKNVVTVSASAHSGEAVPYIDIDVGSLSDANRVVLQELIERGKAEKIEIVGESQREVVKLKANDLGDQPTAEEISEAFLELTANFTVQPLTRGFYAPAELNTIYGYSGDEEDEAIIDKFVNEEGYVFDEDTGLLFESSELLEQYKLGNTTQ